jgi:hypothetical protein
LSFPAVKYKQNLQIIALAPLLLSCPLLLLRAKSFFCPQQKQGSQAQRLRGQKLRSYSKARVKRILKKVFTTNIDE